MSDILGMVTGGFGGLASGIPGMIMDNFIPIAAVVGIGALLNSQGVDVLGNLSGFANNAINSFLGMIDGIGKDPQEQQQTETPTQAIADGQSKGSNPVETQGRDVATSYMTKEEQIAGIKEVLMGASILDNKESILNKTAEKLNLTEEQTESAREIVNGIFDEMSSPNNLSRAFSDREGLVNDAIKLADEKGLFEVIGSSQSIGDKTVSMETAKATAPVSDTQTPTQSKTPNKSAKEVELDR